MHDDAFLCSRFVSPPDKYCGARPASIHGHVRHAGWNEQVVTGVGYLAVFELVARPKLDLFAT